MASKQADYKIRLFLDAVSLSWSGALARPAWPHSSSSTRALLAAPAQALQRASQASQARGVEISEQRSPVNPWGTTEPEENPHNSSAMKPLAPPRDFTAGGKKLTKSSRDGKNHHPKVFLHFRVSSKSPRENLSMGSEVFIIFKFSLLSIPFSRVISSQKSPAHCRTPSPEILEHMVFTPLLTPL